MNIFEDGNVQIAVAGTIAIERPRRITKSICWSSRERRGIEIAIDTAFRTAGLARISNQVRPLQSSADRRIVVCVLIDRQGLARLYQHNSVCTPPANYSVKQVVVGKISFAVAKREFYGRGNCKPIGNVEYGTCIFSIQIVGILWKRGTGAEAVA